MNEDDFNSGGIEPVFDGQEPEEDGIRTRPRQEEYAEHTYRQGIYEEGQAQTRGEYRQADLGQSQDPYAKKEDPFGQNASVGAGSFAGQANSFGQNIPSGAGSFAQQPYQAPSRGFGIASLVLGVISLILFCSCINIILAIVSIIFGIIQLVQKDAPKGMAVAGIITSCLSIVLFIIAFVTFMLSTDFQDALEQDYRFNQSLEDYFMRDGEAPQFDDDGEMYFPDDDNRDGWDHDRDEDEDDTF